MKNDIIKAILDRQKDRWIDMKIMSQLDKTDKKQNKRDNDCRQIDKQLTENIKRSQKNYIQK